VTWEGLAKAMFLKGVVESQESLKAAFINRHFVSTENYRLI
jgi:hypothetical protein